MRLEVEFAPERTCRSGHRIASGKYFTGSVRRDGTMYGTFLCPICHEPSKRRASQVSDGTYRLILAQLKGRRYPITPKRIREMYVEDVGPVSSRTVYTAIKRAIGNEHVERLGRAPMLERGNGYRLTRRGCEFLRSTP